MVKKLSCVSCGSLKRFPHIFTNDKESINTMEMLGECLQLQRVSILRAFWHLEKPCYMKFVLAGL